MKDILNLSNHTHHILSQKIFWVLIEVHAECLDEAFPAQINITILVKGDKQVVLLEPLFLQSNVTSTKLYSHLRVYLLQPWVP